MMLRAWVWVLVLGSMAAVAAGAPTTRKADQIVKMDEMIPLPGNRVKVSWFCDAGMAGLKGFVVERKQEAEDQFNAISGRLPADVQAAPDPPARFGVSRP